MTWGRRLTYRIALPVGIAIIRFFWMTCRIVRVEGAAHLEGAVFGGKPVIVCYWHRHQLFSWRYLRRLIHRGARIGWLISASVDGEVPTQIANSIGGGIVFRGSTTSGGSEALRGMCKAVMRENISIAATPDGPKGPRSKFKPGIVKLGQLSGAPLVPMAWAAKRAWVLKTWDRFVIPKPFTKIVIAVGEGFEVPRKADDVEVERIQAIMEAKMQRLFEQALQIVKA